MTHPTIPVSKEACAQDHATQVKATPPLKFSAELMKMLAQLVMLR